MTHDTDLSRAYDSVDLRVWLAVENLNKSRAAHLFGVSRQTMSNWCNGKYPVNLRERMEAAVAELARDRAMITEDTP